MMSEVLSFQFFLHVLYWYSKREKKKQVPLTALHYLLMIININFALSSRCMIISLQTLNTGKVESCSLQTFLF